MAREGFLFQPISSLSRQNVAKLPILLPSVPGPSKPASSASPPRPKPFSLANQPNCPAPSNRAAPVPNAGEDGCAAKHGPRPPAFPELTPPLPSARSRPASADHFPLPALEEHRQSPPRR